MKAARFIALSVAMAVSAVATFAARPGVGLVLSGGGAKGIAHIGRYFLLPTAIFNTNH